jgi:hypothetical protein
MLEYKVLIPEGIAVLRPNGALTKADFDGLSKFIDAYLSKHKVLHGLVIHAKAFPGWDSFAGLISHIRFIKNHHQKVQKIALVTDSRIINAAEVFMKHFVSAQVKQFAYADYIVALAWLKTD